VKEEEETYDKWTLRDVDTMDFTLKSTYNSLKFEKQVE